MKSMKKICHILFAVAAVVLCALPLFGMAVAPTMTTTENRTLASFPVLQDEDGSFNVDFLSDLGTYFTDHFAGKNDLVAIDSQIQSKVFHESSVSTILVGENDWLYYTDSLDDYLGENVVTERGAYNIAHNIKLMQAKAEQSGVDFLFTVAPNKNSLYDENMPSQYSVKASESNNIALVSEELTALEVPYADLYAAFRAQDEILYCTQDSHWNQKGAVLAYTTIREALGKKAVDYNTEADVVHTKLEAGDLATSLYSIYAEPEWNYRYEYTSKVKFEEGEDWESQWIQTTRKKGKKSLLMFRDSFGISLCPYIAEDYAAGAFSRNTVYMMDSYMEQVQPDTLIVEIVERNLDRFGVFTLDSQRSTGPAIMVGPTSDADISQASAASDEVIGATTLSCTESMLLPTYRILSGSIDESMIEKDTNVYVQVTDGDKTTLYEAYTTSCAGDEAGIWKDNGYLLYLDSEEILSDEIGVMVLTEKDGVFTVVGETACAMTEVTDGE